MLYEYNARSGTHFHSFLEMNAQKSAYPNSYDEKWGKSASHTCAHPRPHSRTHKERTVRVASRPQLLIWFCLYQSFVCASIFIYDSLCMRHKKPNALVVAVVESMHWFVEEKKEKPLVSHENCATNINTAIAMKTNVPLQAHHYKDLNFDSAAT